MDRGAWWAMVHKLAMSHPSSIINSMFLWIWVEMCIHILCLYVEKQMMNTEKLKVYETSFLQLLQIYPLTIGLVTFF